MTYRRDLWEQAAYRQGVVTLAEAREVGVPAVEVRKLAARGVLVGYGNGVYFHRDVPLTKKTEFAVAQALGGEDAFLCGPSVFVFHGLGDFNPKRITVGVNTRLRRTLPAWMVAERRTDVCDDDIVEVDGVRMMALSRALADVKNIMDGDRYERLRRQVEILEEQGW